MSFLHSVYTRAFRISLNQRKGNGLLGREIGAVVAPRNLRRWFSTSRRSAGPCVINTLNPERLVHKGQEICDISGRSSVGLSLCDQYTRFIYTAHIPFPSGTKGILYYNQPPALPPMAGELRFRICDDPSQFAHGRDLEIESGTPWNMPLVNIVRIGYYKGIRDLLLDEGFIDHGLVADLENMKCVGSGWKRRGISLYDIGQPFSVKLDRTHIDVTLNTRSRMRMVYFCPFVIAAEMFKPFSGRIRARFELQSKESGSPQAIQLRVLEILSPITRNPLPVDFISRKTFDEPRPGELIMRRKRKCDRSAKPWALSLTRTSRNAETVKAFLEERALEKEKYGV
ncbi:hypothetical protein M413DRAFT_448301 [Hebeloma cylindrosporum]|uniref:Uncharacterized protein n=1 Tax=Hebeloma cylindrosporum TaxID=76867 RepID=A0A0C3C2E8_HEBCY|nr:hypothetical protein M413DRAFT_448301 [Hebeloma cylindrosporum h7]